MLTVGSLHRPVGIQHSLPAEEFRPLKREIWSLFKQEHTARAIVRVIPEGQQLELYLDGWLLGSQVFRHEDRALDDVAIEHCQAFQARGWTADRGSDG